MQELLPERFPRRLREINDPPKKLYLEGALPPEEHKWLCAVGSRKYTSYGREVCEQLIEGLRGYPVVVVSGLALGVDALAHRAALAAKLPCVAVPGSGLDRRVLYPSANHRLAEEILKQGGALLSEFEPDFAATAWSFPQRNRIMAGLSDAVLVIEAEQKSGTLITARLATEYNRDVCTVPGSIFSSSSAGPHLLIRLGATPITSPDDLLQALGFETTKRSTLNAKRYDDCSPEEQQVIELLKEPLERETLLERLALPVSRANALLSMLELKGHIKESAGEIRLS
ncbi:MAG: DNA-processing protein DprA [Patescibacteria group bacterium]